MRPSVLMVTNPVPRQVHTGNVNPTTNAKPPLATTGPYASAVDASRARWQMVNTQLTPRGISDPRVIGAFLSVAREAFVPPEHALSAYADHPLPIGEGQTISQPLIVAMTAEALAITPTDRVLDVGTGSGYAAAIFAELAREVVGIERHASLVTRATRTLENLGYDNVHIHHGDGSLGFRASAPYDAIAVAAGGPTIPEALLHQLAIGGRLVMPVGTESHQRLLLIARASEHDYVERDLGEVAFVPLVGAQGHAEEGLAHEHPDAA